MDELKKFLDKNNIFYEELNSMYHNKKIIFLDANTSQKIKHYIVKHFPDMTMEYWQNYQYIKITTEI